GVSSDLESGAVAGFRLASPGVHRAIARARTRTHSRVFRALRGAFRPNNCQSSWPRYLDVRARKHTNNMTRQRENPRRRKWRRWGAGCFGRSVLGGSSVYLWLTSMARVYTGRNRRQASVSIFSMVAGRPRRWPLEW